MDRTRIVIPLIVVALVVLPLAFRRDVTEVPPDATKLVIVSPHNEQIRYEFGRAFEHWYLQEHGEPVSVVWSTPGGTSEIRRMLRAQWQAALVEGRPVGGDADLMFGGGTYEFMELSKPVTVTIDGEERTATVLAPLEFDPAYLASVYGSDSKVGGTPLYSPEGYWYGAALSGFGIVYNRDLLAQLDVADPVVWADLADPRLEGYVSLVSPLQSGSVTTAFEAILQRLGWVDGWRILRRAAANSRGFASSAPITPLEVSAGEVAAGVCIDFYGRYQAQAMKAGDIASGVRDPALPDRIGYIDPPRQTVIDPDPVAMLRGAPHPELAKAFITYVLSPEGQALWQFSTSERAIDGLGPERFELRRMPIRRGMYAMMDRFIDKVDPYAIAEPVRYPNRAYRTFIPLLFDAFAMREPELLTEAWTAIISHPAYPVGAGVVTADDVDDPDLKAMLEQFDAMPTVVGPDGVTYDMSDPEVLATVKAGWLRGGWNEDGLWPEFAEPAMVLRRHWGEWFADQYQAVIRRTGERHARLDALDR